LTYNEFETKLKPFLNIRPFHLALVTNIYWHNKYVIGTYVSLHNGNTI